MSVIRFLVELVKPRRSAHAIPLGRLAIATVFAAATIFVVYSLAQDRFAFPLASERYRIEAEFFDAAGLDHDNEPPVSVAGVPAGKVSDVRYENGRAIATLELEEGMRGKVFRDASARTRPINGANILMVNVTPGHPETGAMAEHERIPAARTSIPVATDQALGILDADTRAYLRILTGEAARALRGRGGEVALALREVGPLTDSAREIAQLLRERQALTRAVVGDLEKIFSTVGRRRDELNAALAAGARVLRSYGGHDSEVAAATRELPGLMGEARATVSTLRRHAPLFEEALERLDPAVTKLRPALRVTRELVPDLRVLLRDGARLGRSGRRPAADLERTVRAIGSTTTETRAGVDALDQVITSLDKNKHQIPKLADLAAGVSSIQDEASPLARIVGVGVEVPKPENLGLSAASTRVTSGDHSRLERMLARALDSSCRTQGSLACLVRFLTPGLPGSGITRNLTPRPAR